MELAVLGVRVAALLIESFNRGERRDRNDLLFHHGLHPTSPKGYAGRADYAGNFGVVNEAILEVAFGLASNLAIAYNSHEDKQENWRQENMKLTQILRLSFFSLILVMAISVNQSASGKTPDFNDMLKLAQEGDSNAQFKLGEMYDTGDGVAKDSQEAFKWYKKAAEQGYPKAQNLLGGIYYYGGMGGRVAQDYQEAIKWFRKAAEQGYPGAQCNLGDMYNEGHGVAQDYQEAIKWYKKAAEQDDARAQLNLALMYRKGDGVAKDSNEAIKWYKKAAEQGYIVAQYGLGVMYAKGYDVTQDYQEAIKWFRKAAERGYNVAKDYQEAIKWFKEVAERGDASAQYNLGVMYAKGEGVVEDYVEAYKWLILAAAQGEQRAIKERDLLNQKMTAQQIAEAQKLAKEFRPQIDNNTIKDSTTKPKQGDKTTPSDTNNNKGSQP